MQHMQQYNITIQYSLSHFPFQNLNLSSGLITAPDWLLVTTLLGMSLQFSGTLLSVCGMSASCLKSQIYSVLICPLGVDKM